MILQTAEKIIIQSSTPVTFNMKTRTYTRRPTKTTMNRVKQTHTAIISGYLDTSSTAGEAFSTQPVILMRSDVGM
jgi:hypothetical protein